MLTRSDETDLLIPLYGGIDEGPQWATFLTRLRHRIKADGAWLPEFLNDASAIGTLSLESRAYQFSAPFVMNVLTSLRSARVYPVQQLLFSDHESQSLPWPLSATFGRVIRVADRLGAQAGIIVTRAANDFDAADDALLSELVPHVATALRLKRLQDKSRVMLAMDAFALSQAGTAWICTDAKSRIVAFSETIPSVLGRDAAEPIEMGQRLSFRLSDATTAFDMMVARCAGRGIVRPVAITLSATAGRAMLVFRIPEDKRDAAGGAVLVGLLRTATQRRGLPTCETLMAGFGLTPSEAQIARTLVRGDTLTSAARETGLTIETVRNYSKRIYSKTQTRGQSDLVSTILSGIGGLG